MEPALVALIIIGIPLGAWAAYEGVEFLREWLNHRQERKAYEDYIRMYSQEKFGYISDFLKDDPKPQKAAAFSSGWARVDSGRMKNRGHHSGWEHYKISEQDLLAMDRQLEERKERLKYEQAMMLDWTDAKKSNQCDALAASVQAGGNQRMGLVDKERRTARSSDSGCSNNPTTSSPSLPQWQFANPPMVQEQKGPSPSPDCADLYTSSNDEEDHFLMPAPPQYMRHDTDDCASDSCWANLHSRQHSNESNVSFSSVGSAGVPKSVSSASLSYGVRSITSDDGRAL